jgi:Shedu protein SduA, N-terminal
MEKFTTESTSKFSAHVKEPIVIYQKTNTRRIFKADINDAKIDTKETLSGTIVHQRKKNNDEWEDIDFINLATLKGGEEVRLPFKSGPLREFYNGLQQLYKLSEEGVMYGEHEYVVGQTDQIIEVPRERKEFIQQLLDKNFGEEIWSELVESNPYLATRLSMARI